MATKQRCNSCGEAGLYLKTKKDDHGKMQWVCNPCFLALGDDNCVQ